MNKCTARRGVKGARTGRCAFSACMVLVSLSGFLAGCEAALDLSGVNTQALKTTQRSDLLQAAAAYQGSVVVVGGMGVIIHSGNGGADWQRTILAGKPFLVDVTVCPDGGFHAIDKTDGIWSLNPDEGWVRQSLPEMTEPQAMTCDEANVLWVTGGFSAILNSVDAGASWDSWTLDEDLYLTSIQFVDRQYGVVTGEFGAVLTTADGGETWRRAADLPGSFYPQGAHFTSPTSGWVVGLSGTIWETNSGGETWQHTPSGISIPLYGISAIGETLVAVGDNATILFYRQGDASWNPLNGATMSRDYLRGVAGLGDGQFIVAGGGGVLIAIDIPNGGSQVGQESSGE